MTRCGHIFLVVTALMWTSLLNRGSIAHGDEAYKYERGGVLFYAGFNGGTRDAQVAVGDGKATLAEGGGALTADGYDSALGSALQSGNGIGYVEYGATGNILPDEGTIEIWVKPGNWSDDDKQHHVFLDVIGQGNIHFQKGADAVNNFWVKAPGMNAPISRGYSCNQKKGAWEHFFLIWKKGEPLRFYQGISWYSAGWILIDASSPLEPPIPSLGSFSAIRIGDFLRESGPNLFSFIDEVYIYNRALTWDECFWAFNNAKKRKPGTDIPINFAQPTAKVVPDPEKKILVVNIDSGDRSGNFAGTARLEPASGTKPASIIQKEGRFGEASIPYQDLQKGDYQVISDVTTKDGKPIVALTTKFIVPGPPVWLTEKVGVSDTPPPPWTPVKLRGDKLGIWGREYTLGGVGLPSRMVTQGNSILAGPIELRIVSGGKDAIWEGNARGKITKKTQAQVVKGGESVSSVGVMKWKATVEFDGFLLYDFELTPAKEGTVELMELRVPIKKDYAMLYNRGVSERGFLPKGMGVICKSEFGRYWWIGTDDFGLCGATEHAGANIDNAADAFSIVREQNGDITVIYRFLSKPQKLTEPWKLRWVLQATPTKPLPKNWRNWRERKHTPGGKLAVAHPWPTQEKFEYFDFPVVKDADWYRDFIKGEHAQGIKVLPYCMFVNMPPAMPECAFYWREWFCPEGNPTDLSSGWANYAAARLVPSYIDFMVWKHREVARAYGHDGLYVDYAGVHGSGVFAPEYDLGYERDGKKYPVQFPIVAVREMWKRIYTMFKELKPDSVIVGHDSTAVHAPVLSFCDVGLNGEHNWNGALRDNYLDVLPLDQLRADFRGQQYGFISWWLPQWHKAILKDKDVVLRGDGTRGIVVGAPELISVEKSQHMFGIGLLLDIGFWPIWSMNTNAISLFYGVLDKFGIGDAEFFGYWNNADLIGGQTEDIKASAYRKPKGGALIVVYNVTRQPKTANLTVAWKRLKSKGTLRNFICEHLAFIPWKRLQSMCALNVVDAYTDKPVEVNGKTVTIEVPPLNYRLLWVK